MAIAQVEFTEEQFRSIEELASEKQVTVDELIRDTVVERLLKPTEPTMAEKRRRAMEVSGKFRSGLTDLAENHDKYFAEAIES